MKRLSWKYVAGLIDGEGCLDFQNIYNKKYRGRPYITPRVRVSQSEAGKEVILLLKNNYGGNMEHRKRSENSSWSDVYTWAIQGKKARPFLQNIKNHLIIKKEQAKLLIFLCDNLMGKWYGDKFRIRLKEEIKAMKRDPQRLSERAIKGLFKDGLVLHRWSREFDACISCGTTKVAHAAKGMCTSCYMKKYNSLNNSD